jgi:hypothetical protein
MNAEEKITLPRPAWIYPALRCTVALGLCAASLALVLGSLMLSAVSGYPSIAAAGLLGGALLGACGGLSLLWAIGKPKAL